MTIHIIPLHGIGEVRRGDDVAALIRAALAAPAHDDAAPDLHSDHAAPDLHSDHAAPDLRADDVLVVSSKIVAKAEGRTVRPRSGETLEEARRRLTLINEVLVETPFVAVVRTPDGTVCANAGIDASNMPGGELLLLPSDPDAAARAIRSGLADLANVGVVIADTFGRAWREGQTDVALGVAGMPALRDERGTLDRDGRPLSVTLVAQADQVAGAADLVRDKAAGVPVVIVRGLARGTGEGSGADLVRDPSMDLFPHGRGWLARRLATGEGRSVRPGPPAAWEWTLVEQACGAARTDATRLQTDDGLVAGIAQACLLDLGYDVERRREGATYEVMVKP